MSEHGIRVSVEVVFVPEHSQPGRSVFVYFITLENHGPERAQLLERHWLIEEAGGATTEVMGEGVVGQQPILEPGETFQYNSWTHIAHQPGVMRGWYTFQNTLGERFKVEIPPFALTLPAGEPRMLN